MEEVKSYMLPNIGVIDITPTLVRAKHSVSYAAWNLNFDQLYGESLHHGIQIHHSRPVSDLDAFQKIGSESYLGHLCAKCQAVVHRILIEANSLS